MQAMSGTGSTVGRSAVVVAGTVRGGGGVGVERFRLPVLVCFGAALHGRLGGGAFEGGDSRLWGRLVVRCLVADWHGRLVGGAVVGGASRLWGRLVGTKWVRMSGWSICGVGAVEGSGVGTVTVGAVVGGAAGDRVSSVGVGGGVGVGVLVGVIGGGSVGEM